MPKELKVKSVVSKRNFKNLDLDKFFKKDFKNKRIKELYKKDIEKAKKVKKVK